MTINSTCLSLARHPSPKNPTGKSLSRTGGRYIKFPNGHREFGKGKEPAKLRPAHPSPLYNAPLSHNCIYFTDSPTNAARESRQRRIQISSSPTPSSSNCALKRELYAPRVMLRRDFLRIPRESSSLSHKRVPLACHRLRQYRPTKNLSRGPVGLSNRDFVLS